MRTLSDFSNRVLNRRELHLQGNYESNPGFVKVREEVAKHFKVEQEVVVVKKISSSFGSNEFLIDAFIYDSVKNKEAIEPKKKEKKK